MKPIAAFIFFLFLWNATFAQNDFKLGLNYFNQGNIILADSFFSLYVKEFPDDINGVYNYSVTKLQLGDTCSFCNGIFSINNTFEVDKDAVKMYFENCGYTDTIYYDENFSVVTSSKFTYFEVIEHHKCQDLIVGKYHYKKRKNTYTFLLMHAFMDIRTDIFGVYELYPDSSKVFTWTASMPTFKEKDAALWKYVQDNPIYEKAKEELNLNNSLISIEFIVNKDGRTSSLEITGSDLDTEKSEILLENLKQIFDEIPNYIPGRFNDKIVDFKLAEVLIL